MKNKNNFNFYIFFKSRNLLLTHDQHIKIADMGQGRLLLDETTENASTYVGTFDYMSPEIRNRGTYDYKTDVW